MCDSLLRLWRIHFPVLIICKRISYLEEINMEVFREKGSLSGTDWEKSTERENEGNKGNKSRCSKLGIG